MTVLTPSSIIEKEAIPQLKFSNLETLQSTRARVLRSHYLNRATHLGNLSKGKVRIYFKDDHNNLLHVNTTIWALTTDFVVLKQGITIPIKAVLYIE
ncbi:hypothetical protein [Lacinutrix sp. Hel_I_90]|uniref:hypothetical protein n=1 Tax=Lacinutrix sp. Hel_I_90 TaxID=1249999 RepID=UPI0005C98B89|nr:hypothetical protein [Lacinutrix sp. Hel_I_90]